MLQNAYFLAKIGADTAENEQHFAEILPKSLLILPWVRRGRGVRRHRRCRPADALDAVRSEIPHALAPVHARSAKSLSTLLLSFDGERVTFIATPEENSESLHFTRSD